MHTAARTLIAFCLLSIPAAWLPAADAKDYAGAWEMEIVNSGTTFRACSLKLAEGSGGRLEGEMVWRWGSVMGLKGEEQVSLGKDGELLIKHGEDCGGLLRHLLLGSKFSRRLLLLLHPFLFFLLGDTLKSPPLSSAVAFSFLRRSGGWRR